MGLRLNITAGNDKRVVLQLLNGLRDESREPFPVELSEDVAVKMVSEVGTRHAVSFTVGDEGRVLLDLKGSDYKIGLWGIEVVGRLNGAKWRAYGDSMIHYTATTERGAEQVTVQADAGELTLVVGYATDIVPKRTSELVNDGADGEHPFATEEQLKRYAPLESPKFTGYPEYNDTGQSAANFNTLRLTSRNWVYRFIEWFKAQANGIASLVNGKVPTAQIPDLPYIPSNKKGAANGVAELDANRKVFNDQLYFAPRGTTTAAAMDGELEAGLYLVNGFKVADDVLGGDNANGFLLQGTGASRGQLLVVGRAADAAAGEQVEIYTRRYLPTPKRWTAWSKGGGGGSDEIYFSEITLQSGVYTHDSAAAYQAFRDGKVVIGVNGQYYYYGMIGLNGEISYVSFSFHPGPSINILRGGTTDSLISYEVLAMDLQEAKDGAASATKFISPVVLKQAILYHTSDLVNGGAYNSTSKKIELKHGSTVLAEIDATPFIVDGMVDDVRIENGNLVIDFNTESGKQDIAIPLTEIFNPNNYYTKQQTDGLLSGKASTADVTALQQQVAGKQDTISDLAEIRAGAAAGATAVQPADLQPYATEQWVGEQGFLTQHQDISGKEDKMQVVGVPTGETGLAAAAGCYYAFADDLGTFDITLPVLTDVTTVQTIVFYMTMGSAPAVTFTATKPIYYHDGFSLEAGKTYEVNALWNGAVWVIASVEIVVN